MHNSLEKNLVLEDPERLQQRPNHAATLHLHKKSRMLKNLGLLEKHKVDLTLNLDQGVLTPGLTLTGVVTACVSKTVYITAVRVLLRGVESCQVPTSAAKSANAVKSTFTHLEKVVTLFGYSKGSQRRGGASLEAGIHTFPFEIALPAFIPPSVHAVFDTVAKCGAHATISYSITATVVIPYGFDGEVSKPFLVQSAVPLPLLKRSQQIPSSTQTTFVVKEKRSWFHRICGESSGSTVQLEVRWWPSALALQVNQQVPPTQGGVGAPYQHPSPIQLLSCSTTAPCGNVDPSCVPVEESLFTGQASPVHSNPSYDKPLLVPQPSVVPWPKGHYNARSQHRDPGSQTAVAMPRAHLQLVPAPPDNRTMIVRVTVRNTTNLQRLTQIHVRLSQNQKLTVRGIVCSHHFIVAEHVQEVTGAGVQPGDVFHFDALLSLPDRLSREVEQFPKAVLLPTISTTMLDISLMLSVYIADLPIASGDLPMLVKDQACRVGEVVDVTGEAPFHFHQSLLLPEDYLGSG